jgi:tetratricopeptide (TPR) repeat protein
MTARTRSCLIAVTLYASPFTPLHAAAAEEANAAWAARDQAGQTEKAIRLWQEALKENPHQDGLCIDLTKALGRAVRHASDDSARKKWADEARAAGEKCLAENPDKPEALAYDAEAIGQWANAHKGPGSLKKVKQAVETLKKALALNPHYAYAHMLLAEFYRQAPSMISVGDKKKALEQAEAAVQDDPTHVINHVIYARALIDNHRKEDAMAQLRMALSLPAPADAVPETKADQETARELLRELGAADTSPGASGGVSACSEDKSNRSSCGH